MSEAEKIPVKVEVKTAVILIPWDRLSKVNGDEFKAWLAKAEKVRNEWQAKGYRCN